MTTFNTSKVKKERREQPPDVAPPKPDVSRVWSPQQQTVFTFASEGEGNGVVQARAGSGKTSTIVAALRWFPPQAKVLLCAFNKAIADELETRTQTLANVRVSTCHSIGNMLVHRWRRNARVDTKRGFRLAEKAVLKTTGKNYHDWIWATKELASISKLVAPFAKQANEILPLGWAYGCYNGLQNDQAVEKVANAAMWARQFAVDDDDGTIDFDDMLFLPLQKPLTRGEYDVVLVDEAQDMNLAQLSIAQRICAEGGRIIVVGDDRQAIYGFMGADKGSIDRLKTKLKAQEMWLTTTYRCPSKVVAMAKMFVPDFSAAPEAPEGIIRSGSYVEAEPGDFVLSRTNAPLLSTCLDLIRAGKPAMVKGRDIAVAITRLMQKLTPKNTMRLTMDNVNDWLGRQLAKVRDEEDIQRINDQADVMRFLIDECDGVPVQMESLLSRLFRDDMKGAVVCSTIHKAKGLETDRVFILCETFRGDFRFPSGSIEEDNLKYVAITRTKKELVFVNPSWEVK